MPTPPILATTEPYSPLAALLQGPAVAACLADLAEMNGADPVALATRLRKRHAPDVVAAAMTLADLRSRAAVKFANPGMMLLTRAGYEQASSDVIARWRARRFAGCETIADLCCGIGGDLMALAALPGLTTLTAVDLDPDHLTMALANARTANPDAPVAGLLADVRTVELASVEGVFIDPARRDAGGRFSSGATEPPLDWCLALADRVPKVGIKLAPGIDHAAIPAAWELETIAIDTDLKEAVLWSPALATAPRRATVIHDGEVSSIGGDGDDSDRASQEPGPDLAMPEAGMWLHDPNPAITRAGLVQAVAAQLGAYPIDRQIAFLVGEGPSASPFARSRRIVASLPWDEKALHRHLVAMEVGAIDIRRRGLAGDVDAIARRLRKRLPKGATRSCWIAMTRVDDRPWAIVCSDEPQRA
ncbi:MAG: THUMP-like domain-containing protein [Thermomicrobiales bacterium]